MELRTRHYYDVAIFSLDGRLDAVATPTFLDCVREQIELGHGRLVIDLKKVDFMSSAGVKMLIQATQLSRQQGGDLRLANARGRVKRVLNLAGVSSIIKMFPNVIGATASYFPGPFAEMP